MLGDGELKYDITEKQDYLKDFRVYILHSHIIEFVPNNVVKNILTLPDPEGKRDKWIVVLLEYDLENKPKKLVKGMGLAKMMTDSSCEYLQLNFLSNNSNQLKSELHVLGEFSLSPWYSDIIYVLHNLQDPP